MPKSCCSGQCLFPGNPPRRKEADRADTPSRRPASWKASSAHDGCSLPSCQAPPWRQTPSVRPSLYTGQDLSVHWHRYWCRPLSEQRSSIWRKESCCQWKTRLIAFHIIAIPIKNTYILATWDFAFMFDIILYHISVIQSINVII